MYFRGESLHSPRQAAENNLDTFHVHFCSQIRTGINKRDCTYKQKTCLQGEEHVCKGDVVDI